jgi:hypothetical protein
MSAAYRRKRLLAFWDPWSDPLDGGFQIIQSLIAVGAGGISGRGFMAGVQKLFYLPEPHTDFIFAVIGEEFGLIGTTLILACFVLIAWRGMRVAMQAPDRFGSFLAIGLTTMVAAQALVNISVVLGLMPTKGIPLPFVSSGGSSLVISLVGYGHPAQRLPARGARFVSLGGLCARRDCGWRHRRPSVSRTGGGPGAQGAGAGRDDLLCGDRVGNRGAGDSVHRVRAGRDPERGAQGEVAGSTAARPWHCCR